MRAVQNCRRLPTYANSSMATSLHHLHYRLGEELGRGAYGQVYRGLDTRTGEHVAVKQLSLDRIPTENLAGIVNEASINRRDGRWTSQGRRSTLVLPFV